MTIEPADHSRSIIAITGNDRFTFLQGILTQDINKLNADIIQFAALLSAQGKILHDMFLLSVDDAVFIDTQTAYKDILLKRLAMYKLRAAITIEDVSDRIAVQADGTLPHLAATAHTIGAYDDPRHPQLPKRLYWRTPHGRALTPATIHPPLATLALGIPELGRDFEPDSVVALDAGYDLLHAVSFTKGCYVGQEITARMHYKNIARRGFYILTRDHTPTRLALLKFEEVEAAHGIITVDNVTYHAELPAWMQPKLRQFKATPTTQ
jgi:tRNA-modifying protein YgfZ